MSVLSQRVSIFVRIIAGIGLGTIAGAGVAAGPSAPDRQIAKIFAPYAEPGQPGCTVGVLQGGRLTYASAFGAADIEQGKPLDTSASFNLASVSKQFTAFALLLLEQQGRLSLDDPVIRYLPELEASARGVTLRQLLHHTGGLRDYIGLLMMRGRGLGDSSTTHEALVALARQHSPDFEAGSRYEYSNTGYFLLARVIERVSGQTMAQFSEEQIFRPLGMKDTYIVDRYPATRASLARGYMKIGNRFVDDQSAWEQTGDGQVHSNLQDLALWDENFYTAKVGGRTLIDRMTETGTLNSGEHIDYAAGLRVASMAWPADGQSRRRLGGLSLADPAFPAAAFFGDRALQPRRCGVVDARVVGRGNLPEGQAGPRQAADEEEPADAGRRCRAGLAAGRPVEVRRCVFRRRGECPLRARPARCGAGRRILRPGRRAAPREVRRVRCRRWFLQPAVPGECRSDRRLSIERRGPAWLVFRARRTADDADRQRADHRRHGYAGA